MRELHFNWVNTYRKTTYSNGWRKGKYSDPKGNDRRIMYLPTMWKILTAQINEEINYLLEYRRLFPEELKGCEKGVRWTNIKLFIDQHILNDAKTKQKNGAMDWVKKKD